MALASFFALVATVLVPTLAIQVPLVGSTHDRLEIPRVGAGGPTAWDLDQPPNPNDTDHLVFETVHSLLQHWPNTRIRNGHNVVPGVIPKGTLLYHGVLNGYKDTLPLPQSPDWVSTDPEHAQIFCVDGFGSRAQPTCRQLTFATTRPMKVIYFDGTSAAKMSTGTVDVQELIAWGKTCSGTFKEEQQLIIDLCEWGRHFGVNGFVRMEMDFELMICDFTFDLDLVFSANLTSRGNIIPSNADWITFEVMEAGSRHNRFPGETRIQLDLAGLVSFYDTQLAPSLIATRASQERWDHRAQNVSGEDLSALKSRLEAALVRPSGQSSGIDWKTLIQVIVDRFAERLELTRHLLNSSTTDKNEILDLANKAQTQLRMMLAPYILHSVNPTDVMDDVIGLVWSTPIYKLCATIHTGFMETGINFMTDSERLLLGAVRGTTREICRVVTRMWAAGVYAGIDPSLNTKDSPDIAEVTRVWNTWAEDLNRLMTWLDWSVWVKCSPGCGPEEMCYLPTWLVGFPPVDVNTSCRSDPDGSQTSRHTHLDLRSEVRIALAKSVRENVEPGSDEWVRPQPRCVRRIAPREF